jgi:hypothetical protein
VYKNVDCDVVKNNNKVLELIIYKAHKGIEKETIRIEGVKYEIRRGRKIICSGSG